MDTFPDFNMYAVLENNIVVNVAFGYDENNLFNHLGKSIQLDNSIKLVKMTKENSPAVIGYEYDGQRFSERKLCQTLQY